MKILWVCNVPNRDVYEYKDEEKGVLGGWLTGLTDAMKRCREITLVYAYPLIGKGTMDDYEYKGVHYYSFYAPKKFGILPMNADKENSVTKKQLQYILEVEQPDIVHVFGSEYCHAKTVAELVKNKKKLCCSIQGLTSIYAGHYLSLVPHEIVEKRNFSSFVYGNLKKQKRGFVHRGENEIAFLKSCPNILGRTKWDEVCTLFINSKRKYYYHGEILRSSFYEERYLWSVKKCERHTIFISQGNTPLKGLNIALEALSIIKKKWPDVMVRISGDDFVNANSLFEKLKRTTYGQYISQLIEKNNLKDNIEFLGFIDEDEMARRYQKCHVFVSASSIENSCNSVCEAMMLGVPVVSSAVGGISSLLKDGVEGLLYPADEPYMLAYEVERLFEDEKLAEYLGNNARKRAMHNHDIKENKDRLLEIYAAIQRQGNGD